ncbi:bZIP transcription factor [Ceratobasidium sp. AG-Ba]|nr:bZIP transcription factor [Ceratobasidium sp. AG-Ba]
MSRSQLQSLSGGSPPFSRGAGMDSDDDNNTTTSTGSRPLSRNAQAQARLRARRKAYVESLESNVKRLQALVDALSVGSNRSLFTAVGSPKSPGSQTPSGSAFLPSMSLIPPSPELPKGNASPPSEGQILDRLQHENGRLRRERDALRVQLEALVSYISKGGVSIDTRGNAGQPGVQDHTSITQETMPGSSQSFVPTGPYGSSEFADLRGLNLDLAAIQAYFSMAAAASQYPEYSVGSSTSSSQPFESGMPSMGSGTTDSMDLSRSFPREGSSDGSEHGGSFRIQ